MKGAFLVHNSSRERRACSGMSNVGVDSTLYTLSKIKLIVSSTGTLVKSDSTSSDAIIPSLGDSLRTRRKSADDCRLYLLGTYGVKIELSF